MKVRNVISLAAANLGREDLVATVGDLSVPAGETASLLRCYNLVENEIALDYFPLRHEEELEEENGKISYTQFAFAPVEILAVAGRGGPLAFECRPAELVLPKNVGRVRISYHYSPREKGIDDDVEATACVSERLLSYGVCCEFCLVNGQFAEAATWEKKYRDALRAVAAPHRKLTVRSRRWA